MDHCLAVFDEPELDGERLAVLARHAQTERPRGALLLGQGAQKRKGAFLGFPAGPVDLLIGGPGIFIETIEYFDIESRGLGLAFRGAAQLAGALRPIGREIFTLGGHPPIAGLLGQPHLPASDAEGGGERFRILNRRQLELGDAALADRFGEWRHDVIFAYPVEAKAIPGGVGSRLLPVDSQEQPGGLVTIAGAPGGEPPRGCDMAMQQAKPLQPVVEARLPSTIQCAGGILGHGVQIVEQSDVNRHGFMPLRRRPIMTSFKQE